MRRGPLAGSYPGAVALVVFSLVPYLVLTAGVFPLLDVISKSTGLGPATLDVTVAVSTGAYAAGTVLAVQLAVHLPARRLLVVYESAFVAASVLAAWSPNGDVFMGAFIAQGLCTSLMLIAAVPPLVTRWPAKKMPVTGMIMNLCIFSAVAVGPTLGAAQLQSAGWRPLFWGVAGLAVLALAFSLLTYEDDPARDRSVPWDWPAILLAVIGCAAAFFGAGRLQSTMSADATSLVPLLGGFAMIAALGALFRTRYTPLLALGGLLVIAAAAALFLSVLPSGGPAVAVGAGLLGLGVAASVSPALFMAGFSMRSRLLQRVFAMIELMRGVTAFLVAPILIYLVDVLGTTKTAGMRGSLWICLGLAAFGFLGGVALYTSGRRGLQAPDLERWQEDEPAWQSPPLLSRLRRRDVARPGGAPEGAPSRPSERADRRRLGGRPGGQPLTVKGVVICLPAASITYQGPPALSRAWPVTIPALVSPLQV